MDAPTAANYLVDLGGLIAERAVQAKRDAQAQPQDRFAVGRAFGLYEVVSLMQQQAESFGIDLRDLKLDHLDPDRDLL